MLTRAGRYEIVAELGHGGFGRVYRAFDPQLDSMVAVKTLSVDNDAAILMRFRNEAAASRRLRHPNIVTIYDFGEQDGTPYIVMELLEGMDLKRVIDSGKSLPLWRKIQIMTQVASGLGHAHANGIVHRDVKPANVMLLPDGNIKIMDFGIALVSHDTHNRLTPKGAVIGTFRYLAPEQFRGSPQDARGDIFAYGLMFYELLSGVHPFHSQEDAAVMFNILSVEPVPILELCPDCPEQIQPVVTRLLQKDPEFRYQSLEDVLFDCEPVLLALKRARAHDLFEEAKVALGNRQLEPAQALLKQAMEFDPSYPGARELRERLQTALRRLAVRPRIETLQTEAREHLATGNHAEAVQRYEAALRLDPSDITLKSSLDQAKAALEQARQATRLVAEAERALDAGDLTNAHRIAQQVAELAPTSTRARELVAKIQAALGEQQRQAQLADDLARVRRLMEIRSWDKAAPLLERLEREFGDLAEVRVLRETLDDWRQADERQQKLTSGLAAARQEVQAGSLESARDRLAALRAEFPEAAEVEQLLQYVTSEVAARRRTDLVDRSLRAARELTERGRFADAARVLQSALLSYPADPVLERELRSIFAAQQQAERDTALRTALESAKALQAQGLCDEALAPLDAFSSQYGLEPEVEELRHAIERDREAARRAAELRQMVRRVNDLLAQDKAEEATRVLQKPPAAMEDHPEITQLRSLAQARLDRQLERAGALENALAEANALRRQAGFDQAERVLGEFTSRWGAHPKVGELEKSIQGDREESQRRAEELRRLVGRASDLLAEDKPLEATGLLASPPGYLKDHPDVTRLRDEAELRIREQTERETAFQAAVSSAASLAQQGRFEDALAAFEAFVRRHGPDSRIAAREQAIQSSHEASRRVAAILDLATRSRGLLEQDDPQAAIAMLQREPALVNESPELRELLNAAGAALAARQTREAVEAMLAEVRASLSREDSQAALDVLDRGLKRFPFDPALASARAEALAAQAAQRREEYCAQAVSEIDSLIVKHEYARAASVLAEALGRFPNDPRLLPLRARIEAHRLDWEALQTELRIQDELARARELLPGNPADAVALIERLRLEYPSRPELTAPLAEAHEAVRRAQELNLIREAERLSENQQFAEAAAKLSQAGYDTAQLRAARQDVEARRTAAESERIAKSIASARELAQRDPSKALRSLDKIQHEFPQHPGIGEAVRSLERQSFIAEIEALRAKGKFAKARALHQKAVAHLGPDAGLAEVLAGIETSAAAQEPPAQDSPTQEPATQPSRRAWVWGLAGLGAIGILGGGFWVLTHRSAPSPPAPKTVPLAVEIRTDPQGASVQVGDHSCVTPNCRLELLPGSYSVEARMNGYAPAQQTLVVDATKPSGGSLLTLQPLPPPPLSAQTETGTLVVTARLAGGSAVLPDVLVFVDGQAVQRTDANGVFRLELEAKAHSVRVEKSGYEAVTHEQQVRISKNTSQPIVFNLMEQNATLEVRGAPAGWDISDGGTPIGRTDGSLFSKPVKPGDRVLRVSQGSASRDTQQRFERGGKVTLEWASIAPVVKDNPPPPPPPLPAERDWGPVSTTSDPAVVQKYLDSYPGGPHTAEARTRLEALTWPRVNQGNTESLQTYLKDFPAGPHAKDASAAIDDLVWKAVDPKDEQAVSSFIRQNPRNPNLPRAKDILDQFDKQRQEGDRLKLAKQAEDKKQRDAQLDAQRRQVNAVLGSFNDTLAKRSLRDAEKIWQKAPKGILESFTRPNTLTKLDACQGPEIAEDRATVLCTKTTRIDQGTQSQAVKVTLEKTGSEWIISAVEANIKK
jgi:eukaryotic-like serine/threonine-protein kinase